MKRPEKPVTMTNKTAHLFRLLYASYNLDPASVDTNIHAANLSAELVNHPKGATVTLLEPHVIPRYFGVVYLLGEFGVRVQKRALDASVVLLLSRKAEPEMPEWVDSRVMWEREPEYRPGFVLLDEVA